MANLVRIYALDNSQWQVETLISTLKGLTEQLSPCLGQPFNVDFINGNVIDDQYINWVNSTIQLCIENRIQANSSVLAMLMAIAQGGHNYSLNSIDHYFGGNFLGITRQALESGQASASQWNYVKGKHVYGVSSGFCLSSPVWHGEAIGENLAIVKNNYLQNAYHEFLHLFGVSEGYDESTTGPLSGCESCWMNYGAKGTGLCDAHLGELQTYLKKG